MKRFFSFLVLACGMAAAVVSTSAIGLILVDDEMIFPPPTDPRMPRVDPPANPRMPIIPPGYMDPRHFRSRPLHRFAPLEMRSANVSTEIKDQVAQTKIEQEFYNPSARRLEGTFYLPLPKGAHLEKFALEVNGKMAQAELLDAGKARRIYEEIVRKAQDPGLLEYLGRDLVKVRIFPIEPHSTKKVQVSYTQLLKSDGGLVEFTLPLSSAKYCAKPVKNLSVKVELECSAGLKTVYSPTHDIDLKRHGERRAVLGLEESETRPEKDFQLFYSTEQKGVGVSLLSYRKAGEDGYFMLLATPGLTEEKGEPKDVVFVLDTSGSMAGKKIEQARKALQFCLANLNEDDRFEVIRFSTEAEPFFRGLEPATEKNRAAAEEFVESFKATGGTAIFDALTAAMKTGPRKTDRPFLVVFLTDGLPTTGQTNPEKILEVVTAGKEAKRGITRVFCFGVGTDVNTHLLDRITEETRAVSQYVLPHEDLEVKVSSFFGKISDPVLSDLELDFDGASVTKVHPGKLPDLFKGQQVVAFGRYKKGGKVNIEVKGKSRGKTQEFSYPARLVNEDTDHEFIPRLWATRRVGHLLDEIRLHGENSELKDEVTELAKSYGIVTPYTSFLVTEDEVPARPQVSSSTAPSAADPLAFYRRNPELMKRYFPHVAGGATPPARETLSLSTGNSGDQAVAGARYNMRLKEALNESELRRAPAEVRQLAASGRLLAPPDKLGEFQLTDRYVGGRTFKLEGDAWVETVVLQLNERDPAVRLEFNSKEYWEFAAKNPALAEILAIGTDLKFIHENKLHEIYSKKSE